MMRLTVAVIVVGRSGREAEYFLPERTPEQELWDLVREAVEDAASERPSVEELLDLVDGFMESHGIVAT